MDKFESYGDGFNGRVDGHLFDARAFLIPGSLALGTIVETLQTEIQGIPKDSIHFNDPVHQILGNLAFMPLDAKGLGLSFAVGAMHPEPWFFDVPRPQEIIADQGCLSPCNFDPLSTCRLVTAIPTGHQRTVRLGRPLEARLQSGHGLDLVPRRGWFVANACSYRKDLRGAKIGKP